MTKKSEPHQNSEYWENRIAKETWKTYNSAEEQNRDLLKMYEKTSSSIKRELYSLAEEAEKNGGLTRTQQYRFNKLLGQQGAIFQEIEKLGETIEKTQTSRMKNVGKDVYKNVMESLGVNDFSYPNKKEMEQMLRSPWHGSFFSERLWKDMGVLERNMNGIINNSIATGKTVTEMAVQLSNVMQKSFNVAHRLVRTETINYMNRSALRGYKDAGVRKVQWWAAEDERTCEICGANHEKEYDIDKAPILPCHPGCRCTWIPVIDDESIKNIKIDDTDAKKSVGNAEKVYNEDKKIVYKKLTEKDIREYQMQSDIWHTNLTDDGREVIKYYTTGGYYDINEPLFNQDEEYLMKSAIDDLEEALKSFKLKENVISYRGVDEIEFKKLNVGDTGIIKEFKSTSVKEEIADEFKDRHPNGGKIIYNIHSNTRGAYIGDNTSYDPEFEFLISRNANYKVLSKKDNIMEVEIWTTDGNT